uniref:Protein phosphatase 1, regulatory (inhibitor) subunit 2 n=1 Tax=Cyprinus carpio TaxID=7962 RepID=A0A8C1JIR8_CYPCA
TIVKNCHFKGLSGFPQWLCKAAPHPNAGCVTVLLPCGLVCVSVCSCRKKSQKWDEMNILATYHPADKDYGLMKIDEPSTPYHRMVGDEEDEGALSDSDGNTVLPGDDLAKKCSFVWKENSESRGFSCLELYVLCLSSARKKQFQMMRKMHYNEGLNIKLARQLIASELEEEVDEDEEMKDDTETEDITDDPPPDEESSDAGSVSRCSLKISLGQNTSK